MTTGRGTCEHCGTMDVRVTMVGWPDCGVLKACSDCLENASKEDFQDTINKKPRVKVAAEAIPLYDNTNQHIVAVDPSQDRYVVSGEFLARLNNLRLVEACNAFFENKLDYYELKAKVREIEKVLATDVPQRRRSQGVDRPPEVTDHDDNPYLPRMEELHPITNAWAKRALKLIPVENEITTQKFYVNPPPRDLLGETDEH